MGAQVIFVVNHAYLDGLNDECANWLSLQASIHSSTPKTWIPSSWDGIGRQFRREQAPGNRAALSFSYSDYAVKSTYLIAHDVVADVDGLYDVGLKEAPDFSGLAKVIAKKVRYGHSPFLRSRTKMTLAKSAPAPIEPGAANLTVFTYDTDNWDWSNKARNRETLAAISLYCATGRHDGAFGWADPETGHFSSGFRPITTLAPEQRILLRIHEGQETIIQMPQRPIPFPERYFETGEGRNSLLLSLMASEGYECKPAEPENTRYLKA